MTPEAKARQTIDERLAAAGWSVQDMKALNLGAGVGVAVREYPTDSGPADYVLFVNRIAVGVIVSAGMAAVMDVGGQERMRQASLAASVAMVTLVAPAAIAARQTHSTTGLPPKSRSTLRGRRVEPSRAGMTT